MRRNLLVTLLVLAAVSPLAAAVPLPPKPERYVTDRAEVLAADREAAIEEKLQAFERTTSTQVIVYLDTNLPEGTTLEEMSAAAIREWGVGQKGKDNGAILFLFTGSRDMRIEVGYGLEGALPDMRAKRILTEVMTPHLRRGEFAAAIDQGVESIFAAVRGEPYRGTGRTAFEAVEVDTSPTIDEIMPWLIILLMILAVLRGVYLWATGRMQLGVTLGPDGSTSSRDWGSSSSSSSRDWSSSRSSSSSSRSSSSSGGFRGGGGSGGGGGASGKW